MAVARKLTVTTKQALGPDPAGSVTGPQHYIILADTGNTQTVYVGGSDVDATSNGFPLIAGASVDWDFAIGGALYAIAASGSQVLWVLRVF